MIGDVVNWRRRTNAEVDKILDHEDIVRFAKSQRIRWLGHIIRMEDRRTPKAIYQAKVEGRRNQGRPRNRWCDEVEIDLKRMSVSSWRRKAEDRPTWRDVVRKAKAHTEL